MAQRKGQTGNPNGRPKGIANKATTSAREAIASFVEGNTERLNRLLDTIENGIEKDDGEGYVVYPNPKGAFDSIMAVCEYHLPKLARSEVKADITGSVAITLQQADKDIIDRYIDTKSKA